MPAQSKPNILFIMADDIGWFNVSAYNLGIMGYRTPNIDRIAKEGALFTDFYGQQSCTAGRAAQALATQWLESFKEFPIRQKPASFNLDHVGGKFMPKAG
jgi:hypothetical protein